MPGICQEYAIWKVYKYHHSITPSSSSPHFHSLPLSLSRKATAKHPLSIHQFFSFDHHIPSPYKYQGSRIRRLGANGKRMTSFSCFYPPYLRLDSSLASS
ncbi:hypothetical protein HanRHA438_Chr02g0056401 [Helianthus annuus]|nr:hypothetical protein HanRHA438_Chr02g0056401 [Helianthus annuus]